MRIIAVTCGLALLAAACASPSSSPYRSADLTGEVSYRQKIAYGPGASLVVYLVDVPGPREPA